MPWSRVSVLELRDSSICTFLRQGQSVNLPFRPLRWQHRRQQKVLRSCLHYGCWLLGRIAFRPKLLFGAIDTIKLWLHDLGQDVWIWWSSTSLQKNSSCHATSKTCSENQVRSQVGNALKTIKYFSHEKACFNQSPSWNNGSIGCRAWNFRPGVLWRPSTTATWGRPISTQKTIASWNQSILKLRGT